MAQRRPRKFVAEPQALNFLAEQGDAQILLFLVGRENVYRVALHAEGAAVKVRVVSLVLHGHEGIQKGVLIDPVAYLYAGAHLKVGLRLGQAVDAGDGGHDDHVPPRQKGARGREPEPVEKVVAVAALLDVSVARGNVGLRLEIVVIGDEIFHRVLREEALHLAVELGGQSLVGRQYERRASGFRYKIGHGESLAGAGDAQKRLRTHASLKAFGKVPDGRLLVAHGRVGRSQLEKFFAHPA